MQTASTKVCRGRTQHSAWQLQGSKACDSWPCHVDTRALKMCEAQAAKGKPGQTGLCARKRNWVFCSLFELLRAPASHSHVVSKPLLLKSVCVRGPSDAGPTPPAALPGNGDGGLLFDVPTTTSRERLVSTFVSPCARIHPRKPTHGHFDCTACSYTQSHLLSSTGRKCSAGHQASSSAVYR